MKKVLNHYLLKLNPITPHPQTNSSTMGFPQGTILGPLLFFIYVNDFNNCLTKSKAIMFANDTTVWTSHKNT